MQADITRDFMVHQMTKTNHILHLLISIFTAGLWIPVWILVAMNNASKRSQINGGVVGKTINVLGKVLWGGLAFVVGLVIVVGIVMSIIA